MIADILGTLGQGLRMAYHLGDGLKARALDAEQILHRLYGLNFVDEQRAGEHQVCYG